MRITNNKQNHSNLSRNPVAGTGNATATATATATAITTTIARSHEEISNDLEDLELSTTLSLDGKSSASSGSHNISSNNNGNNRNDRTSSVGKNPNRGKPFRGMTSKTKGPVVWDRLFPWPTLDRLRCCVPSFAAAAAAASSASPNKNNSNVNNSTRFNSRNNNDKKIHSSQLVNINPTSSQQQQQVEQQDEDEQQVVLPTALSTAAATTTSTTENPPTPNGTAPLPLSRVVGAATSAPAPPTSASTINTITTLIPPPTANVALPPPSPRAPLLPPRPPVPASSTLIASGRAISLTNHHHHHQSNSIPNHGNNNHSHNNNSSSNNNQTSPPPPPPAPTATTITTGPSLPLRVMRNPSTATNGTTSSFHRRKNGSFAFSVASLQEIHDSSPNGIAEPLSEATPPTPTPTTQLQSSTVTDSLNSWATVPMTSIRCSALSRECSELYVDEEEYETNGTYKGGDPSARPRSSPHPPLDEHDDDNDDVDDLQVSDDDDDDDKDENNHNNKDSSSVNRVRRVSPTSVSTPPDWMLSWAQASLPPSSSSDAVALTSFSAANDDNAMIKTASELPAMVSPTKTTTVTTELDTLQAAAGAATQTSVSEFDTPITYLPYRSETCLGWMAVSCDDNLMRRRGRLALERRDLALVRIIPDKSTGRTLLVVERDDLCTPTNKVEIDLRQAFVSTTLIAPEWGRAVVVRHRTADQVLCTLLPVSLPPAFFETDENRPGGSTTVTPRLVPDRTLFEQLAPAMVTPFCADASASATSSLTISEQANNSINNNNSNKYNDGTEVTRADEDDDSQSSASSSSSSLDWGRKLYAPDEQQDAAMNLLFRLDTIIRTAASATTATKKATGARF